MISRYTSSPFDPDNSRNFWGYVVSRTFANPPSSGAGRWFAWIMALSMIAVAVVPLAIGAPGDAISWLITIIFGIAGVVLILRLLGGPSR